MPVFEVTTVGGTYSAVVERGSLARIASYLPAKRGKVFVVTEEPIWHSHGGFLGGVADHVLFLPGGEENKRLAPLEALAEQMVDAGADRTSVVIAFGGGIVNDMGGFLAAIFLRGIPVIQAPTTLLAQVDAAVGGKTGVNLTRGKNLIGSFHQPLAVIIDPSILSTLPDREFRAGLYEVIKCGVIASPELFETLRADRDAVIARQPGLLDRVIAECVRIKAEVVSADEREGGLRKILNFGHTVGHALEAETGYRRFLHGEAVAFGMRAATLLAASTGKLAAADCRAIVELVSAYGPIPPLTGITAESLLARLVSDKKTVQGRVHFVLPVRIGETEVVAGIPEELVSEAIRGALQ